MTTTKTTGRLAGLAYLVIIVCSTFGYLTTTRLLDGGPAAALHHISTNLTLFDLALTASAIGLLAWIAVGLLAYRLAGASGRIAGLAMLAFVAGGVAMNLAALWQLLPLTGPAFGPDLNGDLIAPMLARYNRILLNAQVFSGLWLFPFGWLVVRSRIAPLVLGLCLMAGCFGYLSVFATAFAPGLDHMSAFRILTAPFGIAVFVGEAGICLWLLIMGARSASATAPSAVELPMAEARP
jgi:hypothetical protein